MTKARTLLNSELNRLNNKIEIYLPSGDILQFFASDVLEAVDPDTYKEELELIEGE